VWGGRGEGGGEAVSILRGKIRRWDVQETRKHANNINTSTSTNERERKKEAAEEEQTLFSLTHKDTQNTRKRKCTHASSYAHNTHTYTHHHNNIEHSLKNIQPFVVVSEASNNM